MTTGRMCLFVDESMLVEGRGYRVSVVREGEAGHHPTGTWPYTGKPGEKMPWFWGRTKDGFSFEEASKAVDEYNARLGLSKKEASEIVASSFRAQFGKRRRRG